MEVLEFFHSRENNGLPVNHQVLREHFNLKPCNASNRIKRLLDQELIKSKDNTNERHHCYVLTDKGINKLNWKKRNTEKNNPLGVKKVSNQLGETTDEPEKTFWEKADEIFDNFLFEE